MKEGVTFGFISQFMDIDTLRLVPHFTDGLDPDDPGYVSKVEERLLFAEPIVATHITGQTPNGQEVDGYFCFVMLTAAQMLRLPRAIVLEKAKQAIRKLADCGSEIVGLGSLTGSGLTGSGLLLQGDSPTFLTSGNTFAALSTVRTVEKVAETLGFDLATKTIGILGATGSIGGAVSLELSKMAKEMRLVARTPGRLKALNAQLECPSRYSTEIADLAEVDILVVTTASSESLIPVTLPQSGMIIVDETKPKNLPVAFKERKDVLVVDGAYISTPAIDYGMDMDCPSGMIYSCLAETIMLALRGIQNHYHLGAVDPGVFPEIRQMSEEYGLDIAPLQSFDETIHAERLAEFVSVCCIA